MKAILARALLVVTALLAVCAFLACSSPPDPVREVPLATSSATQDTQGSTSAPSDQPESTGPPGQHTHPAASTSNGAGSPADTLFVSLQSLNIDQFFEASWRELALRDPETVLADGLGGAYGLQGAELTNISDAYLRDTQQMRAVVLDMLRAYDRDQLEPEQQISYDVYEWYLEDKASEAQFMYYDYPATFFPVTAVHELTTYFFSDLHPIATSSDAEAYVTRLGQVDAKFGQLLEGLRLREEAGIVPPAFASQWALYGVRGVAGSSPTQTPYYHALATKVDALEDLTAAEKQELLDTAVQAIEDSVLPAYQDLATYLEHLASVAPSDDGLWQFPNGDAYYDHLLRHYSTTGMSAGEIHDLGLLELERVHAQMRDRSEALGYPEGESIPALFDRVAQDGGQVPASEVIDTYTALIDSAEQNLDAAFDLRPQAELQVVTSPIKGMYVSPSLDGTRPGAFHAGPGNAAEERYAMPTLAYHEAIPGHHFQISIAQESELPAFRGAMSFDGYTEGWALYSEQLAAELGWYDDDPYGDLGRLQAEAFRAARLVVDTGIHAKGWTFDQALDFFVENTGYEPGDSVEPSLQIARYIVWPGQSTAYKIGMIKILELRQRAMDELGDRFDLKAFHNVLLRNGSMPLEILEQVVDGYIEATLSSSGSAEPPAVQQQGSATPPRPASGASWPVGPWPVSTPEEQGMDSELLADMLDAIRQKDPGIDAVAVVRNGHLVLDATVAPFAPGEKHIIHSCTKSIVSALIGIAIDQGYIRGVDQPVLDLLPGRTVANLDARKQAMTLEHLLTMTTGLDCQDSYLYRWRGLNEMRDSDDWVQHMLDLPMVAEPGSVFEYCNGASFLLSAIIQETTGMSAAEYAQENLFSPLGISDLDWPSNPQGISIGWGELLMRPHDLAKIGYLYLHDGQWAGQQLVPSSWVAASTAKHIPATLQGGYGYQWWIDDSGRYYMALGYAGQFVFVLPELDLVAVFVSDLDDRDFYAPQELLHSYILPSVQSSVPLPANTQGVDLLQARLAALAAP